LLIAAVGVGIAAAPWVTSWWLVVSHLAAAALGCEVWRRTRRQPALVPAPVQPAPRTDWDQWLNQQPHAEQVLRDLVILAQQRAGLGVWTLDVASRVYACDDNLRHILGVQGELTLDIARGLVHAEDRAVVDAEYKRLLCDRQCNDLLTLHHRTVRADGSVAHIETFGRVIRAADGWAVRIQGITRDVTADVERALQLEEQARHVQVLLDRLSVAVQAAGIAAWEMDLRTREFLWMENPSPWLGLGEFPLQRAAAELGRMMHPDDLAQVMETGRTAIASGKQTYSYRFRVVRNGITRHMQAYAHIVRDGLGRAVRLIGATSDITNEVQTHELLQRQAEQGQALLERLSMATRAAGIGFWEMDLAAQTLHELHDPAAVHDGARLPLLELRALQHPEDRGAFQHAVDQACSAGSDVVSYRQRIQDGAGWAHKQSYARLILDAQGRPQRALGLTWDVTKEAVAAERLEQQARHERALFDRLSMVTHTARISSWEIDLQTQRFLWLDNLIEAFRCPDGSAAGAVQAFADCIHPEDRAAFDAALREALTGKLEMLSSRHRALGEKGEVVHLQTHFRLAYDTVGRPLRLLGVAWDVSPEVEATAKARQQAEERLVVLEKFALATQAADIHTWELDLQTHQFVWIDRDELNDVIPVGSRIEAFMARVHPEDRDVLPIALRAAIKEAKDKIEYRYRTVDAPGASLQHWHVQARLYRNDQGRVTRIFGMTREITREVAVAAKLEEQAQHERTLIDRFSIATQTAKICSWEVDLRTRRFLWVDNPITTVNGVQDLSGDLDRFFIRVHPEDRIANGQLLIRSLMERKDFISWSYRDVGDSALVAHIQTHARITYDQAGHPLTMLGVSWDVTSAIESAEKLTQQAQQLHEAQRRLERASLSSSEGHWESDLVQQRLWFSSSYYALLGYREGELSDASDALYELVHAEDLLAVRQAHQQHLQHGNALCVDARMRTASGEYRWFRQRGTAERDAQGQAVSMAGSIQDVHQQKLAEDALNLAQRRLERAINGTQDGLWEQESGGIAWCSPRVAELLGYASEELPSDTDFLRLCLHPDDAEVVERATQLHLEHDLPYQAEIRLRTKQGEYRWYRARAAAERDAGGRRHRLSGSLQDVTEARAARQALLQATEAAQAASRAKSEFLANVSHEIRTPMNGIIGMTGLLLDTRLDRTQRDYASTIRGSADSLLAVINDILDFSKIEAGKLQIDVLEFDLVASVEEVAATLALQASAKQLELVVDLDPQVPLQVTGDPQRVRQCLLNLVGNAVKFTQQGEVVIEVRQVSSEGRSSTRFEVRDTGIGIAPGTLDTLFQPFVQADSSTTRHFGGTGLGLSIVRRLVEMMGGNIGVASELGRGSCFWFELPLLTGSSTAPWQPVASRSTRRVLLAESSATSQRVLAAQLEGAGYVVELARDGHAVIQRLLEAVGQEQPFEVLLADARLPGVDGTTLVARVAAQPTLAGCRVVVLAHLGQADFQVDSPSFAGCLFKPVRRRELLKCVQRALEHRSGAWHLQTQSLHRRPAAVADARYAGRVLLVEDNIVNQKVAERFLERLGCEVTVADNGEHGAKAYREDRYDLVLMDLQMPVMDGLTATRCIREFEPQGRRTPIVALTANAMPGQEQSCSAAGMDGFLTKPLDLVRLQEVLRKHGLEKAARAAPGSAGGAESNGEPQTACVDLDKLRELTEGDARFLQELAETFAASGAQVVREMHAALAAGDLVALGLAAHKLKGAAANVHAGQLALLAHCLEIQAPALELAAAQGLVEQLGSEFLRAAHCLEQQFVAGMARAG
jgi:PAS domain S-box-containing protein